MNKEEIENKKRILRNFSEQGQGQRVFFEEDLKLIRDILKELEQKESILDKVTELVNKIATKNAEKYNSKKQKEVDFSEWNLALEILNIIKGGRNGN